jgi:putative addiction module component (TIGR02574 family)
MPETSLPTPPGFDALSKAEQVRYVQALWDQISEDPDALPVRESHLLLAEERLKRYRENPSRGRSAFEFLDQLANTHNANDKSK